MRRATIAGLLRQNGIQWRIAAINSRNTLILELGGGEGGIRTPVLKNADKYGLLRRSNVSFVPLLCTNENENLMQK
jgi:hypothetical protein